MPKLKVFHTKFYPRFDPWGKFIAVYRAHRGVTLYVGSYGLFVGVR